MAIDDLDPASLGIFCTQPSFFTAPHERALSDRAARHLALLLPDWQIAPDGIWIRCTSANTFITAQGWKIHISCSVGDFDAALEAVAPICARNQVAFKCIADISILRLTLSSVWPRAQSGKTIVIYPGDTACFRQLLKELDTSINHLESGPRVLSDQQYGSSGLLSYRYGAFERSYRAAPDGSLSGFIKDPQGILVPDERYPWYECPHWLDDPFGAVAEQDAGDLSLKSGQYLVEAALKFDNSGGVYQAINRQTGAPVIVKEARPGIWNTAGTHTFQGLLRREYEVLQLISDTVIGAKPIDFFEESGHCFSVQTKVEHDLHLGTFTTTNNPLYTKHYQRGRDYMTQYFRYIKSISEHLCALHRHNLVHGDLSFTNILCAGPRTALVDFGSCFRPGLETPPLIATPGLGWASVDSSFELDVRALGYLMLGCYILPAGLSEVAPHGPVAAARLVADELGWDQQLIDIAEECIGAERADSHFLRTIRRRLCDSKPLRFTAVREIAGRRSKSHPAPGEDAAEGEISTCKRLASYIVKTATPDSDLSLYRCSPLIYERTPFAISWGVTGVLLTLSTLGATIPAEHLAWWESRVSSAVMPAGLYSGLAGNVLLALKLDRIPMAEHLMMRALKEQADSDDMSYFQGASGVGLACYELWRRTGDPRWRRECLGLASVVAERGQYRRSPRQLGLAFGSAGESVLMAKAYHMTGESRWFECGRAMIRDELSQMITMESGISTCLASTFPEDDNTYIAYWDEGTAGLLGAVCHWILQARDDAFVSCLPQLLPDCERVMTATGGLHVGMAGLGMALLDAYAATARDEALTAARRLARNLRTFLVDKGEAGLAFAGWQNLRFACDLAYGSSGVALFLWRLASPERGNPLPGLGVSL